MSWNDQNVEQLKTLWIEGLSASQIARALGAGISRNAVMGKIHRMGLSGKGSQSLPRQTRGRTPQERIARAFKTAPLPPPPIDEPAPLLEPDIFAAEGQCKWPHGETNQSGWVMCGHPAHKKGSPWCLFHQGRAYDTPRTKAAADRRAAMDADALQTRMARRMGLA
jgi:GcrA cell cycle regulator